VTPVAFLRTAEALALLERAARCAAAPVSVHFHEGGAESPRVVSVGGCMACWAVSKQHGGRAACRDSRKVAVARSLRRSKPIPFLCHMGFSCVTVSVFAESDRGYTLSFGPYCPASAPGSLEGDARAGWERLGGAGDKLPDLVDIQAVSADAVPAVAEWTAEDLTQLWLASQQQDATEAPGEASGQVAITRRRRSLLATRQTSRAHDIAMALAGGDQTQARRLLEAELAEAESGARAEAAVRRARAIAVVAAVLEAAERAGLETRLCWAGYAGFVAEARGTTVQKELIAAAMRVLSILKRRAVRDGAGDPRLVQLQQFVRGRIPESVTLKEVSAALGENPTAITHRLQRKFGLSFSQYVGRMRVDLAKELLRRTKLDAGEVGRRVGVNDTSNFGKLFRKFEGMSPVEYRKQFGRAR
jgi:AraC-like DNA-binding protein